MQYSEEFKQKVLSVCGESEEIKKMLETGNEFLGRYLDDARYNGVSAKEIVEACENMNLQGVYKKAKRQLALEQLYGEWCDLSKNQGMHR